MSSGTVRNRYGAQQGLHLNGAGTESEMNGVAASEACLEQKDTKVLAVC